MSTKPEDRYEVRVRWSEEDNVFVADFPGLPSSGPGPLFSGARGDTRQEALANAEAGLRESAEESRAGREGPSPGTFTNEYSTQAAAARSDAQEATQSAITEPSTISTDRKDAREVGIDLDVLGDV